MKRLALKPHLAILGSGPVWHEFIQHRSDGEAEEGRGRIIFESFACSFGLPGLCLSFIDANFN